MKKLYALTSLLISLSISCQVILDKPETSPRTVQDPTAVILANGFHATAGVSNPFVAKIGPSNAGDTTPPADSDAGSGNPQGTLGNMNFHDTQGTIDVNGGGQLQYTLPIALPPGVKSVAPQINLVYTSGSGNGIAGYGWNLSGITSISRMGRIIEKDGEVRGIQLDYSDYYAFNGQRLILKSGEYGRDGAEYVTEKFSNVKIRSLGSVSGNGWTGPEYWEVTFEDGSQAWYGNTSESRTPVEYSITKWRDAQGNYISYNYSQSNNVSTISNIQWGGNEAMGKTHFNEILFNYSTRDINEASYVHNQQVIQNRLLSSIIVRANSSQFKRYDINYKKQGTGYQFVDNIVEKNSQDQPANAASFENNPDTTTVTNILNQNSRYDDLLVDNYNLVKGDFNGDGKLDVLKNKTLMLSRLDGNSNFVDFPYEGDPLASGSSLQNNILKQSQSLLTILYDRTSKKITLKEYSLQGNSSTLLKSTDFGSSLLDNTLYGNLYNPNFPAQLDYTYYNNYIADDETYEGNYNGYGYSQFVIRIKNIRNERRFISPREGGPKVVNTKYLYSEEYFYFDTNKNILKNLEGLDPHAKIIVSDFDGDGKTDILQVKDSLIKVYTFDENNDIQLKFSTTKESLNEVFYFGDYNGDGKADILAPIADGSSDWLMYISTGNGFRKEYYSNLFLYQPMWQGPPRKNRNIQRFYSSSDLNKDGKSDFLIFESQVWYRDGVPDWNNPDSSYGFNYLSNDGVDSNGKPIFTNTYHIDPVELNMDLETTNYSMYGEHYIPLFGNFRIAQLNTDFAIIHKTKLITWDLGNKIDKISRIKAITQGGVRTDIDYAPLDASSFIYKTYADSNPLSYPYANISENLNYFVVSKLTQGARKQEFRYRDLVGHLQGRGMLGFRQTARSTFYTDALASTKIWSGSEMDPLNEALPLKDWSIKTSDEGLVFPSDISINNPQLLSFKSYQYKIDKLLNGSVVNSYSDFDKPKIVTAINPYVTISKDFQKDVKIIHTVETYNKFYLPTRSTTNVNDGFAVTTSELEYYPENLTPGSGYSIGKPKSKTELMTAYGDTKGAKEDYEYESNLLKSKTSWNQNNTGWIREAYAYDGFGNVTSKTTTSIDGLSQNEKAEYDPAGRFVVKKTDNLGLQTTIQYNDWGQVTEQTDPLSNKLTNTYDAWGKLLTSKTNLGGTTTYTYEKFYNGDAKVTEYSPDGDVKTSYTNKIGQNYRTTAKAVNNGRYVSKDILFDELGRKVRESEPYFEGEAASQWNTIVYDDYSRPVKATSFTGKVVESSYNGRTATVTETNANNRFKRQTADPLGNIVSSEDKGGVINFKFNAAGQVTEAKYGSNTVTTKYDEWGRKSEFYDPSNGLYKYSYNAFGQVLKETSSKGYKEYAYNALGQLVTQREVTTDGTQNTDKSISYSYNDKGMVTGKSGTSKGKPFSSTVTYDNYGRVLSASESSNGRYYMKKGIVYDDKGRVTSYEKGLYSSGIYTRANVENVYGDWSGELLQLKDKNTGKVLWELQEANAKGQVMRAKLGAADILNLYDQNGFLMSVSHTTPNRTILQVNYRFDAVKNELLSRNTGGDFNILESFNYDENNRLVSWTNPRTGGMSSNGYDAEGRIKENDMLGSVKFENNQFVYRPTSVVLNAAVQQKLANDLVQTIVYNENNDPVFIDGVKGDVRFEYGLAEMRQMVTYGGNFAADGDGKFTKYYSEDGSFEVTRNNQTGEEKHILYIGGSPYESNIIFVKNYTESSGSYKFLHKDYLGSILAISDEAGNKLEQRHFDAWGNLTHLQVNGGAIMTDENQIRDFIAGGGLLVDRGYTSHEHFAEVGLIHMNGRLYDPLLRRFLNADENIQDPYNTQNYNKYGYVMNNPLMFNDPSGEVMGWDDVLIAAAIAIFTSVATDYYMNQPINIGSMLTNVMMSIMSAGIADGIGTLFKAGSTVAEALGKTGTIIARAGAHAISQGALSLMQGGNFWSSALAGAFASAAGDLLKLPTGKLSKTLKNPAIRFMTGAIVAGIGSKLAGGNFWTGAAIGGIITAFNHMNHDIPPVDFNEDYYYDPETGNSYYKVSEYLYEVRDESGNLIQEKYISQVTIKFKYADIRQQMQGYKILGNVLLGVGFAMTITGVGAPAGVVLMSLGGGINTAVATVNTLSYMGEKRYSKAAWEAGGEVASLATGGMVGKFGTVNKELFRGYNKELGKEAISFVAGDVGIPLIEHTTRTSY